MNVYKKSYHRVFSMKAHIVLCTKYRYSIITGPFEEFLKTTIKEIGIHEKFDVIEMKADKNHIHILIDYDIKSNGDWIISQIKKWSNIKAYRGWKQYLESIYQNERLLWSAGGFICSTGQGSEEVVAEYIRNQGLK